MTRPIPSGKLAQPSRVGAPPLPFRFVHAADIHLDSPLRSLALRNPALADLIGNATRDVFSSIVDLCLAEQVDALLLAGDLYDGEQTSMKTARFLADNIRKLHQANIRVFIIRGNHDNESRITKELTYPDTVKLFGGRAGLVEIATPHRVIAIHGISFAQAHAPESLLPRFKPPAADAVNIGLLHTSLGGALGHDNYAPCPPADLHASGFRYWALGHIHKRAAEDGAATIVMPGMPQGRDINEPGAKSVTLATIHDDGAITIEERITSLAQFERVNVDLTGVQDWPHMLNALRAALESARQNTVSPHLVARLKLFGETPLAWRLRQDPDLLRTEAEIEAEAVGRGWIDKLDIDCRPPRAATPAPQADPIDELRRLMEAALHEDAYRADIMTIAEDLRRQLPPDLRDIFGADPAAFAATLEDAARDGMDDVLARLRASGDPV